MSLPDAFAPWRSACLEAIQQHEAAWGQQFEPQVTLALHRRVLRVKLGGRVQLFTTAGPYGRIWRIHHAPKKIVVAVFKARAVLKALNQHCARLAQWGIAV